MSTGANYTPVAQKGFDSPQLEPETSAANSFWKRRRPWLLSFGIAMLILTIVAIVASAVVINVTSMPNQQKCLPLDAQSVSYAFANSSNAFTSRVHAASSGLAGQNMIVSAFSLNSVLSLVLAGAGGSTAEQLRNVLALPCNLPSDDLYFEKFRVAHQQINEDDSKNFLLRAANRMFVDQSFTLDAQFREKADRYFKSLPELLPFKSNPESARNIINRWVEAQTENRIKDIMAPGTVSGRTKVVLANAVYFKAAWANPFKPEATNTTAQFHTRGGKNVEVSMMYAKANLKTSWMPDGSRVVQLPYVGWHVSMVLVLPPKNKDIAIDFADFELAVNALTSPESTVDLIEVLLPRFKIESEHPFKPVLASMGIEDLFGKNCNLSGLVPSAAAEQSVDASRLYVDEVLQKAFINVDENGTEAAAATVAIFKTYMSPIPEDRVVFDRPFAFVIVDSRSGLVLFSGRVEDPSLI